MRSIESDSPSDKAEQHADAAEEDANDHVNASEDDQGDVKTAQACHIHVPMHVTA